MPGKAKERRSEIAAYSPEELQNELTRLTDELVKLRTQAVTEKVEDNSRFRKVRRDIARIMTARHAKRPDAARPPAGKKVSAKRPAAKRAKKAAAKPPANAAAGTGAKTRKAAAKSPARKAAGSKSATGKKPVKKSARKSSRAGGSAGKSSKSNG